MSRSLAAALIGVVLLVACGGTRSQADQDKDGKLIADALRAANTQGSTFKLDQQLLIMGGDIPAGRAVRIHSSVDNGVLKNDAAKFAYRLEQGQQAATYDMLITQGRLFVKARGSSTWKTTPLPSTTTLYPALRLDLVRETVLLARSISSGAVTHIDAGFAHKYTVRPAPDQLEQLQSVSVQGSAEDQFLKTATAQLDVYLLVPGNKLGRIEIRMTGTDPSNGEKQEIRSLLDLRPAKVATIQPPSEAQQVAPADLLT